MSSGLYIGMTAASARAKQVELLSDNLANAQTPGFRATRATFEKVMAKKSDNPNAVADKVLTGRTGQIVDTSQGTLENTGNPLDIALPRGQWFKVLSPGGQVQFTKNGALKLDANGRLLTTAGPILSAKGGPIFVPPGSHVEVASDGAVLVNGRASNKIGVFELAGNIKRTGPATVQPLSAGDGGLVGNPHVLVGQLEGSNAKALESTIELISAQRAYDQALQAVQTTRTMDQGIMSVGRVR